MMILKVPVNHGGRLFAVGESVAGKLPPDYIDLLRQNGHLEVAAEVEQEPEEPKATVTDENDDLGEKDLSTSDLIKQIEASEDIEELNGLLQRENERPRKRSNVMKALDRRLTELEQVANSQALGDLVEGGDE